VPVLSGDTPDRLAERVLAAEHRLYPHALSLYLTGRIGSAGGKLDDSQVPVNQEKALFWPPLE
jgi:folate-dependent phosphoribosylglycinamide formyltransferase PurN